MVILCVDDNAPFLKSMAERFEAEGYKVDAYQSCEAAAEAFMQHPFRYDVVVTDIDFPLGNDGEQLALKLIELRETRGYDPAPEIICITGAKNKMKAELVNRLRERGCHYVLKGTDQYFIEVEAAKARLERLRAEGPTLLFTHGASSSYEWGEGRQRQCQVGEAVERVMVLHGGKRIEIKLAPAPRLVFDFLAKHATRRALSVEEVANAMALDEFYAYWQSGDKSISSDSVKNNIRRIRVAIQETVARASLPLRALDILCTQTYEDQSEPQPESVGPNLPIRSTVIDTIQPFSSKTEFYRLKANIRLEHIP